MSTEFANKAVATLEDLVQRLGNIPLRRIVLDPPPGRATEKDLVRLMRRTGRSYELVEGTLVEKAWVTSKGRWRSGWDISYSVTSIKTISATSPAPTPPCASRPAWSACPTSPSSGGRS